MSIFKLKATKGLMVAVKVLLLRAVLIGCHSLEEGKTKEVLYLVRKDGDDL